MGGHPSFAGTRSNDEEAPKADYTNARFRLRIWVQQKLEACSPPEDGSDEGGKTLCRTPVRAERWKQAETSRTSGDLIEGAGNERTIPAAWPSKAAKNGRIHATDPSDAGSCDFAARDRPVEGVARDPPERSSLLTDI